VISLAGLPARETVRCADPFEAEVAAEAFAGEFSPVSGLR
jgi:hypothetical protein